ncbi:MAG: adenylyl-sulfate kinase [Rhodospirillaceae bacterium]|nr:adenylyl-sulfate kinase [Rhodospirillaceae bacterium]OUT76691.1 MAG: hypothetical protein CBB83_10510 [Rhodospirillaceae bacterium TMED23]|tara:strand:- start:23 stop:541 length:519 start_codon:yes stop_codon:yes gene_type:complete
MSNGIVVWITGLSGSGKSTISQRVVEILRTRGQNCILLDGDEIRKVFPQSQSRYNRKNRLKNARRNSELAKLLADQGFTVIFATMSLFTEIQDWNRSNFPTYIEVFIDVPLEILKIRDSNNLYSRAEQGLINNVVGINLDYDVPKHPELVVDNSGDISEIEGIAHKIARMLM